MAYILARAVNLSWFAQNPYSPARKWYDLSVRITEPIVSPCRRLLSRFNTGMFDFSVLLAFFLIEIVARVITLIIYGIAY